MYRVLHVMRKEFLELKSDPRLFGVVVLAPMLQLVMLGYAASTDVNNVPIAVVDEDRSSQSRDLIARFDASPNFSIIDVLTSMPQVDAYLDRGRAWMVLAIPANYGDRIRAGRPAT